jgi:hypothetical protein
MPARCCRLSFLTPTLEFNPSLTDLSTALYYLLPCRGTRLQLLAYQRKVVSLLQHWLGAHCPIAYLTPTDYWVDCFISGCHKILWPVDWIFILGCILTHATQCSSHSFVIWELLEQHNTHPRLLNNWNPQDNNIPQFTRTPTGR